MRPSLALLGLGLAAACGGNGSGVDGGDRSDGAPVDGTPGMVDAASPGDGGGGAIDAAPAPACPRLAQLPRVCVPLPQSGNPVTEVAAAASCPQAGYFQANDVDVRRLYPDTLLLKETGDSSGERPVMALFLGTGQALLLDTGNRSVEPLDVVTPLLAGRALLVVNTHLHGDHIGRNEDFDVIALSTPELDAHCGASTFDANHAAACAPTPTYQAPNDQVLFQNRAFRVVRVVRDGHVIDLGGGRSLELLATPGHSETSVTLYDGARRTIYTGDTLYPGSNPALVHPSGSSYARYLETAGRLAARAADVDLVVGAHGEGVMPTRVLPAFLALVQDRADGSGPTSVTDPQGCATGGFVMGNDPAQP